MEIRNHFLPLLISIFCLCAPASGIDYVSEIEKKLARYKHYENWGFSGVGQTASGFINLFLPSSISSQIKDSIGDKNWKRFTSHSMKNTFVNQVPLSVVVCIGLLIALVLIAFPCMITICRKKYPISIDAYSRTSLKSWVTLVFSLLCLVVALFAAGLALYSSLRAYYTLKAPFKFTSFVIRVAFEMSKMLQHSFEYRIHDISRAAHEQVMALYNINEDIVAGFNEATKVLVNPFLDIAATMHWQIAQAKYTMQHQKSTLKSLINDTISGVEVLLSNLTTAVEDLKEMEGKSAAQLKPLLKIQKLNLTVDEADVFDEPIKTLKKASKINLPASIEAVNVQLGELAKNVSFDPSDLISKLNKVAFKQQKKISDKAAKYIAFVDKNIGENNRDELLSLLNDIESEVLSTSYFVPILLVIICSLSLIFMVVSFAVFFIAVIGLDGCSSKTEKTQAVIRCFKVLLTLLYVLSCLIFACFAACVALFFFTALPLQYCESWRDLSFITSTVDNPVFHNSSHWLNAFSFRDYSSSMKDTIVKCQEDTQYFLPLPDPLIDMKEADVVKKSLNFTDIITSFEKGLKDLTEFNVTSSQSVISKLSHALENFNFSGIFTPMENFKKNLTDAGGRKILSEIKDDPKVSSNTSIQAEVALQAFDNLVRELDTAISQDGPFNLTAKSINMTLLAVSKQMDYLNWTSDALHEFLTNDSAVVFKGILKEILYEKIDGIFFDMQYEASQFRQSMSTCKVLMIVYEKGGVVLCNIVLYPMAVAWLGFLLLSIFMSAATLSAALLVPQIHKPLASTDKVDQVVSEAKVQALLSSTKKT